MGEEQPVSDFALRWVAADGAIAPRTLYPSITTFRGIARAADWKSWRRRESENTRAALARTLSARCIDTSAAKRGVDAAAKHRPKKAPPLHGAKLSGGTSTEKPWLERRGCLRGSQDRARPQLGALRVCDQSGRTSAPIRPQRVHTMRGPSDRTGISSGSASPSTVALWLHLIEWQ
jgi:hypothetical protein